VTAEEGRSHLARLELLIIMQQLNPRLRNPKIIGELMYMRSALISSIKQMHITFDPEVSVAAA